MRTAARTTCGSRSECLGQLDDETLEYRWGPDWLVWDAAPTTQQYGQHGEYTLRADHTRESTAVNVNITVEPNALIPDFLIKKAGKAMIDAATQGLRRRVLGDS